MKEKRRDLAILTIFLVLFPFYLWSSGLPQLSTLFMAAAFLSVGVPKLLRGFNSFQNELSWLVRWIVYTGLVNLFWWGYLVVSGMRTQPNILFTIFYVYNFCVVLLFISVVMSHGKDAVYRVAYGSFVSVLIQVVASRFVGNADLRGTAFFNNPNQLGYFALLSATLMALAARSEKKLAPVSVAGIALCSYLAAISLSKAAMLGCVLLAVMAGTLQPRRVLPLAVLLGLFLVPSFERSDLAEKVESRLDEIGADADDSAGGRGYDRIWKYPEHLVFGAGEGGVRDRFVLDFEGEMHSSFGTILFSYGIPGTLFFGLFFLLMMTQAGVARSLYLLPSLFYGLTHMGLRFTLFWVVLAFALALSKEPQQQIQQIYKLVRRPFAGGKPQSV